MQRKVKALLVGMGISVLVALAISGWIWAVYDRLPDELVTHWGLHGADSFAPRSEAWAALPFALALSLALGLVLVALLPATGRNLNFIAGMTASVGTLLAGVTGGTVALQAGRAPDDPLLTHALWLPPLILVAALLGILASRFVGPPPPRPDATRVPSPATRLRDRDRTRDWKGTVDMHPGMAAILLIPLVLFVIIGVAMGSWALPLTLTLVLAVFLASTWRWHLRVDDDGLTCRGMLGWPSVHHPLREIEEATTVDHVGSFTFGGPGLRNTREGERLAVRSGPALRLELSDGTDFIVTTPDADRAARVLNTRIAEQREAAARGR